jgi:basic membrane protein A
MRTRAAIAAVLLLAAGCGGRESDTKAGSHRFRVALLLTQPAPGVLRGGAAREGLTGIETAMGAEVACVDGLQAGRLDAELRRHARSGFRLIFGEGAAFEDAAVRVAPEFPETWFVAAGGARSAANVASIRFRFEEAAYELGVLAGMMSRSHAAGVMGAAGAPSPPAGLDAFAAGARSVRPDFRILEGRRVEAGDSTAAREAALALIAGGADFLFDIAGSTGPGLPQAAREHPGVYVLGAWEDRSALAPDVILASAVVDAPKAMLLVARQVRAGAFEGGVRGLGFREGVVFVAVNPRLVSHIAMETRTKLTEVEQDIRNGRVKAPAER